MTLSAGGSITKSNNSLSIGIVQADAIIIPIAMYKNGIWFNYWPFEEEFVDVKLDKLSDIPSKWYLPYDSISTNWIYYDYYGNSSSAIVTKPILSRNNCDAQWGLLSDIKPIPITCDNCCPFPKIGFAFDSNVNPQLLTSVINDSEEVATLELFVTKEFDNQEYTSITETRKQSIVAIYDSVLIQILSEKQRISFNKLFPIKIDSLTTVYYFEASKVYNVSESYQRIGGCNIISSFQGWVSRDIATNKISYLQKTFDLTDCDMKGVSFLEPYYLLNIGNRSVLLARETGWESENYVVLEITREFIKNLVQ